LGFWGLLERPKTRIGVLDVRNASGMESDALNSRGRGVKPVLRNLPRPACSGL